MQPERPEIQVHRIWTEYRPDPSDPAKMREVDMVAYGPMGAGDRSITNERVSRLSQVKGEGDARQNPAVAMATYRWNVIKPFYEAYKAGREHTVDGTPLAAWNAVTPEQAEVLRIRGVHTVEQLAGLTDAHVQRFGIPGLRGLADMAGVYLKSADATRATAQIDDLKAENDTLKEQLAELTALVKAELEAKAEPAPTRKK